MAARRASQPARGGGAPTTALGDATRHPCLPQHARPACRSLPQVAIKILDKEKIQKQNMGAQIKKEVRGGCVAEARVPGGTAPLGRAPHACSSVTDALPTSAPSRRPTAHPASCRSPS